ncbi:hypothetical protein ACFVXG_34735 [Kitasatospora sp. NPDC058162]|uniref:hypothetical protein n=1 Tax=Kitasatospora sp. NPDC058162 TaxID=3346362 RepID=UPI0036DD6DF4
MVNRISGNVTIAGQVIQSTGVVQVGGDPAGAARDTAELARAVAEDLDGAGAPVRLSRGEYRAVLRLLAHLHDADAPEGAVALELADLLRGR